MTTARAQEIPHGLRLLIEAAGEEAALTVALYHGGARLRIPKRADGSHLAELVGIDAARAIVDSLADERIAIPLAKRHLTDCLRATGWSQERRARPLQATPRTIQHWAARPTTPRPLHPFTTRARHPTPHP